MRSSPTAQPISTVCRIAFGETAIFDGADEQVTSAVRAAASVFESLGASVDSIEFPEAGEALALNPGGLSSPPKPYALNRELIENHLRRTRSRRCFQNGQGTRITSSDYLKHSEQLECPARPHP